MRPKYQEKRKFLIQKFFYAIDLFTYAFLIHEHLKLLISSTVRLWFQHLLLSSADVSALKIIILT